MRFVNFICLYVVGPYGRCGSKLSRGSYSPRSSSWKREWLISPLQTCMADAAGLMQPWLMLSCSAIALMITATAATRLVLVVIDSVAQPLESCRWVRSTSPLESCIASSDVWESSSCISSPVRPHSLMAARCEADSVLPGVRGTPVWLYVAGQVNGSRI